MNAVFYATTYHPIQAGSIDGTDTVSHDNGVYRALVASSTGLYDPTADPKATGDPYNTLFVGRLASHTTEKTLHEAMSRYGTVKQLRLVRDIVTGASRRYAFVHFESEDDMHNAYEAAQHHVIDGSPIIVDYNRQQLMTGWIPRRLGGGLGGRKESGQLRFGGRDRPFRAPLRPIPEEHLTKLGIPLPPVGRYMSRFQLPPVPQRQGHLKSSDSQQRRHKRSPTREDSRFEKQADNDREVGWERQFKNSPRPGRRYAASSQRWPSGDSQSKHQPIGSSVESEEHGESGSRKRHTKRSHSDEHEENESRKHHKKWIHSERMRDELLDVSERAYQTHKYNKTRSHPEVINEERYQYPMSPSISQERAGNATHHERLSENEGQDSGGRSSSCTSSYNDRDSSGRRRKDRIQEHEKSSRLRHEWRSHSKSRSGRPV